MKTVSTREYVAGLRELTEAGNQVCMRIAGNSMSPFLVHQRDTIQFEKPTEPLKRGDMVFFQRIDGDFIMHRILQVRPEGLYIVGDAQQFVEGPIDPEQVFAIVTRVERKGKWIGPESFWWKFFQTTWLWLLPVRPTISRCYGVVYRISQIFRKRDMS